MKKKVVLVFLAVLVAESYSDNIGNCEFQEDYGIKWDANMLMNNETTDTAGLDKRFNFIGSMVIGTITGDIAYIQVTTEDGTDGGVLIFQTNDNFTSIFEENTPKRSGTATISVNVELKCSAGSSFLNFIQPVTDTNNHDPVFGKPTYDYLMPMPMVPKIDLTSLGEPIVATDVDFTNQNIEFTVDDDDFQVITAPVDDSKNYRSILSVTTFKRLTENKTITITATDDGSPPRSTTAQINITIDPNAILPDIPKFSKAKYKFTYSDTDGDITLTPDPEDPIIKVDTTNVQKTEVKLEINPYFEAKYDKQTGEVIISPNGTSITSSLNNVMVLELTAILDDLSSVAIILIDIPPEKVVSTPTFTRVYYTATYNASSTPHTVTLDDGQTIAIHEQEDVTISLVDDEHHFSIQNVGEKWTLTIDKELDNDTLDKGEEIRLTLAATVKENVTDGAATLIVKLPEVPVTISPTFSRVFYTAQYVVTDGIASVSLTDGPIALTSGGNVNVVIKPDDTHAENFAIVPNTDSSGYTVQVKTNLNGDTLSKEVDIVLTLQLSTDDINNANVATLVIQLPKQAAPAAFSQAFYLAKYQLGSPQDTVQVTDPIELTGDNADSTNVKLEGELSENFRISDSSPYVLTLEQNIDPSTLAAQREIVITLVASLDDSTITFKSSIIINTPSAASDIVPKFSRLYYYGSYNNDNPDTVTIKPITIVSDRSPDTKVAVDGDYSEYFEAAQNVDGTWTLNVVKPLSDDDLNAQNEIIVNLIATLNEAKDTGRAIAIIDFHTDGDLKPSPTFTSPKYTAKYEVDISGVASVEYVDGPIKIPYVADAVDLTLDNSNFDLNYNDITDQWDLTIVTPLSPELFKTTAELIVVISSHMGNHVDGAATLVIQLPGREEIEFDKPYYEATYKVNDEGMDSVVIPQDIVVADGVQVAFQENFGDHFDIQPSSSNTWQLSVKSDLSETDLSTKSKILLVVEATKPDTSSNSSATIVVSLPLQEQLQAPQFDQPLYQTNYLEDKGAIKSVPVSILGVTDVNEVTVEVDGDNKELFIVTPDGDHWELTSKNLPTSITDNEVSIVFTLKATKTGVAASGLANVVVDLPKKTASSEFHFDRNVYVAQYTIDNAVTVEPIVIDGFTGSVELSIEGDYSSSFGVKNEDENVVVSVSQPLESDVLNDKITLSLIIRAKQGADEAVTTLIVELPKTRDSNSLVFSNTVYTALYDVNGDSLDTITLENGPIQINDVSDLDNIDIQIDGDYKNNFDVVADGSGWTVKVQNNLQPNVVQDNISVLLTITATAVDDNSKSGQTSLVIQFRQQSVSEFQFKSSAYMADYEVEKSKPSIKVEKTIIVTGETDSVKLTGDYSQYFEPSSSPTVNETTISISTTDKVIPDEIYKKSAISLQLEATKGNEVATATLVVTLPRTSDGDDDNQNDDDDDDGDDTALIIAVAILAVLLVASIVGSGVFYYLKFRRGTDNYSNMDEDVPRVSERFRKNSNSVDAKHKFDHPARRPTGITKYPLGENVGGETNTDEEPIEKRKSVQFDVINIEEREIEPEKLEEDVDEGNNYDAPATQDDNAYENLNNEHSNETSTDDIKFNL